jgi:Mn-dependent DtxR family transcriptional regulator
MSPDLETTDIKTWCYLTLHARGRGFCESTDKVLAEAMSVVPLTVKRSLARLEDAGFIRRERKGRNRIIHLIPEGKPDAKPVFRLKVV